MRSDLSAERLHAGGAGRQRGRPARHRRGPAGPRRREPRRLARAGVVRRARRRLRRPQLRRAGRPVRRRPHRPGRTCTPCRWSAAGSWRRPVRAARPAGCSRSTPRVEAITQVLRGRENRSGSGEQERAATDGAVGAGRGDRTGGGGVRRAAGAGDAAVRGGGVPQPAGRRRRAGLPRRAGEDGVPARRAPVYANTTAAPYPDDAGKARDLLAGQLARPVEWVAEIENLFRAGVRTFLEVGPGARLTGMVGAILSGREHEALALDASNGQRSGVFDLACCLACLAVLGYGVDVKAWDGGGRRLRPPADGGKPTLLVPICGANYVKPKPTRPPAPAGFAAGSPSRPSPVSGRASPHNEWKSTPHDERPRSSAATAGRRRDGPPAGPAGDPRKPGRPPENAGADGPAAPPVPGGPGDGPPHRPSAGGTAPALSASRAGHGAARRCRPSPPPVVAPALPPRRRSRRPLPRAVPAELRRRRRSRRRAGRRLSDDEPDRKGACWR